MPSYKAPSNGYAGAIALSTGDTLAVVNDATVDSGITNSQQVNVEAEFGSSLVGIQNNTNQDATVYTSAVDVLASYTSAGLVVTAGTSTLNPMSGFLFLNFATPPTTGSAYFRR